jgi:hypothetical protein
VLAATHEAIELYDVLEEDVIPRFYDRDDDGLPRKWIAMMRESHGASDAAVLGKPHRSRIH